MRNRRRPCCRRVRTRSRHIPVPRSCSSRGSPICRSVVRRPSPASPHDSSPRKNSRSGSCCHRGLPMVCRCELRRISTSLLLMLCLHRSWLDMLLARRRLLSGSWRRGDPAGSAVVTHVAYIRGVVYDGLVIHIGDIRSAADVVHASVVVKGSVVPVASFVTYAAVPEPVINPAVKTDMRPPITGIPDKCATAPTPITRGPQNSYGWRHHPGAGHPVISTILIVSPITGSPDIARRWAGRLHINRQCRWRYRNR